MQISRMIVIALVCALAVSYAQAAELRMARQQNLLKDRYIVVFNHGISDDDRRMHMEEFRHVMAKQPAGSSSLISTFQIGNLVGFGAMLSADALEHQLASPRVAYIEQDQLMHTQSPVHTLESAEDETCNLQRTSLWNLERIIERQPDADLGRYVYPGSAGENVDAYIVDTGILTTHEDFGGRATWAANFVDNKDTDCNGHGTHVAGTVGGTTYGVAKKVNLFAVKVLGCLGSGSNLGVIKGVQFVADRAKNSKNRCVANMSLGGGVSKALDDAVNEAVANGCFFAVAAGNDNADACNNSPARSTGAATVGATELATAGNVDRDVRSVFSNYGNCVQIFAPGTQITSDWIGSNNATNTISGTSMATPSVCGAAALYRSVFPQDSVEDVKQSLYQTATDGLIDMDCGFTKIRCTTSPNRLLFTTSCDSK